MSIVWNEGRFQGQAHHLVRSPPICVDRRWLLPERDLGQVQEELPHVRPHNQRDPRGDQAGGLACRESRPLISRIIAGTVRVKLELTLLLTHGFIMQDGSRTSVFGHSMGGHGALTLYLKSDEGAFKSCSAFSPIAWVRPTPSPCAVVCAHTSPLDVAEATRPSAPGVRRRSPATLPLQRPRAPSTTPPSCFPRPRSPTQRFSSTTEPATTSTSRDSSSRRCLIRPPRTRAARTSRFEVKTGTTTRTVSPRTNSFRWTAMRPPYLSKTDH
jgi:hypothetical protein